MSDLLAQVDRRDDLKHAGHDGPGGDEKNQGEGGNARPGERQDAEQDTDDAPQQDGPSVARHVVQKRL